MTNRNSNIRRRTMREINTHIFFINNWVFMASAILAVSAKLYIPTYSFYHIYFAAGLSKKIQCRSSGILFNHSIRCNKTQSLSSLTNCNNAGGIMQLHYFINCSNHLPINIKMAIFVIINFWDNRYKKKI